MVVCARPSSFRLSVQLIIISLLYSERAHQRVFSSLISALRCDKVGAAYFFVIDTWVSHFKRKVNMYEDEELFNLFNSWDQHHDGFHNMNQQFAVNPIPYSKKIPKHEE